MVEQAFVELVEELKDTLSIQLICEYMDVPRATYYRGRKKVKELSVKDKRDQAIGDACAAHKYRYGYRKISILFLGISEKL